MSLFFLFLGFAVGAAFYVVAGRGYESGGLELPQRLGLVVAVGLALGLAGLMFVKQAEQDLQRAIERDRAERGRQDQLRQDGTGQDPAGQQQISSAASDQAPEGRTALPQTPRAQASDEPAVGGDRTATASSAAPADARPARTATPASSPSTAASSATDERVPTSDLSEPERSSTPPSTSFQSEPRDSDLQCAYSPDTDRCLCVTLNGQRADVDYERCRALVSSRED